MKRFFYFVFILVAAVSCTEKFTKVECPFIIGKLMGEQQQAIAVVKIDCYVAVYIFGTNICRNWLNILRPGTAWYKFVDLLYYVLSVKFIERFNIVKKWQDERSSPVSDGSPVGKTILDKDDN